jgi:hypothetical protein
VQKVLIKSAKLLVTYNIHECKGDVETKLSPTICAKLYTLNNYFVYVNLAKDFWGSYLLLFVGIDHYTPVC